MSSPSWNMIVALDGTTQVRVARQDDGTATIMLSSGAVSIRCAIDGEAIAFLFAPPRAEAAA